MILLSLFALLAGIATVLSPCILPVLPAILSASASGGKRRPLGVILGLVTSFIFFTLALGTLVETFGLSANFLRYFAMIVIALFGLVLIIPSLGDWFAGLTSSLASYGAQFQGSKKEGSSGFGSGFVVGIALGLVWTPCAGPILAAITTLVATQSLSLEAVLLTVAYSLGAAIPLLFLAYGGKWALNTIPSLAKHSEGIRKVFGGLMILTALALYFNWDVAFQQKIADYAPKIGVEQADLIKDELSKIRSGEGSTELSQKAPDFVGITEWINSAPLTIEGLKGKVLLVDFWTYSCINCIRTLPYLRQWDEAYKDKGLVIVGVHTPEFEFEKSASNVKEAVKRFEIHYPVAMDNHYKTWQAYHNQFWPAHYLIDQEGNIRNIHYGEGAYGETENAIRSLLALPALKEPSMEEPKRVAKRTMTPETYLGHARAEAYSSEITLEKDKKRRYTYTTLAPDAVGLKGDWIVRGESIEAEGEEASLSLNFEANRVYLVLGGKSSLPIRLEMDDKPLPKKFWTADMTNDGTILVKEDRKYDILNLQGEDEGRHTLTLYIPKGIKAYAFTFGEEK